MPSGAASPTAAPPYLSGISEPPMAFAEPNIPRTDRVSDSVAQALMASAVSATWTFRLD